LTTAKENRMTTRPPEPEITWTLPMAQANMVLAIIGKQPFETVADLIMELRNQATAQIQLYQQQLAQSQGGQMPEPARTA
jgi:hypothetical protein